MHPDFPSRAFPRPRFRQHAVDFDVAGAQPIRPCWLAPFPFEQPEDDRIAVDVAESPDDLLESGNNSTGSVEARRRVGIRTVLGVLTTMVWQVFARRRISPRSTPRWRASVADFQRGPSAAVSAS